MGLKYQAVLWNRQKKIYDLVLAGSIVMLLVLFVGIGAAADPDVTAETLLIRGFGLVALVLLHVILSIGPLCRVSPRFLPLLYNRRHMGVAMFFLALVHGVFSIIQFHALGDVHPLISVLISNTHYGSIASFPFQILGLAALLILFLMAVTSHDFWLANLTPPVWKTLHMLVYIAYALIILHVATGVLQAESNPLFPGLLAMGFIWILALHLVAAANEHQRDRVLIALNDEGYVDVCGVSDIAEKRAHIAMVGGERIAIFRYDGKISVISNVCQHQNGPLGEGCIIGGFVTCPWHGFQYRPEDGASPAPFKEKVPTFNVKVHRSRVWVDPRPNAPGTRVEPARIAE